MTCSLVTFRVRWPICIFVGLGIGERSLRFLLGEGDLERPLGLGLSGIELLPFFFSFSRSLSLSLSRSLSLSLSFSLLSCLREVSTLLLRLRFLPRSLELPEELAVLLDELLELEVDLELLPLLELEEPELLSDELLPLLEEEAARFFRSFSRVLSFLFSLSVASESLLPVLSFRLRAMINDDEFFLIALSAITRKAGSTIKKSQ